MPPAQSHEPTSAPHQPGTTPPPARKSSQPRLPYRLLYRLAAWVVPERNPAGAVYGLITIGALLAAESGLRETYPETVGSAAIAVTLYWFAHSYADVLGLRLSEQRRLSWRELWETFVQDWSIARGASAPLLALLVAWAAGASQTTAVTAGVWTVVGSLIAFEVAAGVRSRAKPVELALEIIVGTTMGLAILALRALLH
jgi:signal transduction histidine kinase